MSNHIFARICAITILCSLITGCSSIIKTAKAPTIPYDGPYVIVEPKVGYPGFTLDESGFKFPAGETVTIDFIDPNGQIAPFHESHPKTYVTDIDGKFTYYYTVREEELAGLWAYYASYGTGENRKQTPSVSFWITNPTISVIPDEKNLSATLNGVGFSPGGKARITVDYIYADLAPSGGEVIKETVPCEVDIDKTGKFYNRCKAERGMPSFNRLVGSVRFSAIDLTTGYPSISRKKIEVLHTFSAKVFGQEVPPTETAASTPVTQIAPVTQAAPDYIGFDFINRAPKYSDGDLNASMHLFIHKYPIPGAGSITGVIYLNDLDQVSETITVLILRPVNEGWRVIHSFTLADDYPSATTGITTLALDSSLPVERGDVFAHWQVEITGPIPLSIDKSTIDGLSIGKFGFTAADIELGQFIPAFSDTGKRDYFMNVIFAPTR